MTPKEETPQAPPETQKPRRRWKRWVFAFLVVLIAFFIWFNGPGIRWTVEKIIATQLATQKLSGSFEVTGTALQGLAVQNIALQGESKIKSLHSDLLTLSWSPTSLLEKRIDSLSLEKFHLVIDPEAPPIPKKIRDRSEDDIEYSLSRSLKLVRELILPSEITLRDLRVEVIGSSSVSLAALTHTAGSDQFILRDLRSSDHLNRAIHDPSSTLTWTETSLALNHLSLLPNLSLQNFVFHPDQDASGELFIDRKKISLFSDLKSSHRITLHTPPLDIRTLADLVKPGLIPEGQAEGKITALEIDTSKGFVNFQATDLRWKEQKIASASLQAHTPDLLSPFEQAILIEAKLEDRLTLSGTLSPAPKLQDSTAELSFTFRDPAIPDVTGDIHYHSRQVQLEASMLADLLVSGTYFLDSSTYTARASSTLQDASQLDPLLSGPLIFSHQGSGNLKEKSHSGTLHLNALQLQQAELTEATTAAIIQYDWPKKITVQELTTTAPEGQLRAELAWQDDVLTVSQLDLIEDQRTLLNATATLPAPLKKQSLEEILNSPEKISLQLKSQPLSLQKLSAYLPLPPQLSGVLLADLNLTGTLAEPKLNGFANLDGFRSPSQPDLPPIDLELEFNTEDQQLIFTSLTSETSGPLLHLDGSLPFLPRLWIKKQSIPDENTPIHLHLYSPKLDLQRLNRLPNIPEQFAGTLETNLTLTGSLAKPTLDGFLNIDSLRLGSQKNLPPLNLNLDFKTENQRLILNTKTSEPSGPLLNITGSLPFLPELWLKNKPHPADSLIDLRISAPNLDLKRFNQIPGLPEEIEGLLRTDLSLAGSLEKPRLDGFLTITAFRLQNQADLPPVSVNLNFDTTEQTLALSAKVTEPGGPLVQINGQLPFLPKAWIERKKNPNDTPILIRATSPDLDLRRLQPFIPIIKKIDGKAQFDLLITGTISEPVFDGAAKTLIANMRLTKSPMSTFRQTKIDVSFNNDTIKILPSIIKTSGGTASVSGDINFGGTEPVFDIALNGQHVLLHRTPDYTFRGHPKLRLIGPYSAAKISGSLQITESLFYKNLEILPFGVPRTTEIPQPKLPTFSQKNSSLANLAPPTGVENWQLEIDVTTADPILIRGNLARGEITGTVKVTGTINDPRTSGTLTSKDLRADLPFSDLEIQSSLVTLRPESLTNPLIDLRGSSTIGKYTVEVFLTGPVQKPTLILTSDPPLPESEIMLLLATGSASAELEDRQVASQKALQYLLEGLRRRNRGKDKSVLQRLLKNSDQIELSLGDTNQFSGRKFSSATLEIADQWDFTTQIDELGQTRALIVFSLRLK